MQKCQNYKQHKKYKHKKSIWEPAIISTKKQNKVKTQKALKSTKILPRRQLLIQNKIRKSINAKRAKNAKTQKGKHVTRANKYIKNALARQLLVLYTCSFIHRNFISVAVQ